LQNARIFTSGSTGNKKALPKERFLTATSQG